MPAEYPNNPRLAIGGVVIHQGRVLLVRRDQPPAYGQWAIPGGGVELGEPLAEAVQREIKEETGLIVRAGDVCHVFEAIHPDPDGRIRFHYVIVDLLAEYVSGNPAPATDVSAADWFGPDDLGGLNLNQNTRDLLKKLGFTSD